MYILRFLSAFSLLAVVGVLSAYASENKPKGIFSSSSYLNTYEHKWQESWSCKPATLASTFEEAKKEMKSSSGYWFPVSTKETDTALIFTYRDGLSDYGSGPVLSKRAFFKSMKACKETNILK